MRHRPRAFSLVELPAVSRRERNAFTLVELLVVIGIIAVLLGLLMPVLHRVRQQAVIVHCASNLRQVHQALSMYLIESKGTLFVYRACFLNISDAANVWLAFARAQN